MRKRLLPAAILFICCFSLWIARGSAAQNPATGAVEFQARVMPSGGHSEPVRGLPFYLLRKSLDDIRVETEKTDPAPDMNRFIDTLEFSPELRAWMKEHHTVNLQGKDFTSHLTGEDIVSIKEFMDAYTTLNGGTRTAAAFPNRNTKRPTRLRTPKSTSASVHALYRSHANLS